MFFQNLTAGEFLALASVLGAFITALYLLDRAKRKKIVSTLRFWPVSVKAEEQRSRTRVREPWSLALQLISVLLLLLAISEVQWGTRNRRGRDYVILLDTSAWTAEQSPDGAIIDREKDLARRYLATLRPENRVMLARVDALATPVTSFTSDRGELRKALDESQAGFSALNIEQALSFAEGAQKASTSEPGEIVYVGPKLVSDRNNDFAKLPNLRVIPVEARRRNCGIQRIGVKQNEADASFWQAVITLRNYDAERNVVQLKTQFERTIFPPRTLTLGPGEERTTEYKFAANGPGRLIAEITPGDALRSDDRAVLDLPGMSVFKIAAYTNRPEAMSPLFQANPRLTVRFFKPAEYDPKPEADMMLLDRTGARERPAIPSLWIDPPDGESPLPVKAVARDAVVTNWGADAGLGMGLHAKETRLNEAKVFELLDGDRGVANVSEGPVVVVHGSTENRPAFAVIGFDPLSGPLRYQVTAPLLFANLLRWFSPEAFRTWELGAAHVGTATVALEPNENPRHVRVRDESEFAIPFTIRKQSLELFTSRPSIIHISGDWERVLSLTLPEIAEFEWKPPSGTLTGLPSAEGFVRAPRELWKWLAVLGGTGLFIEWMWFGRRRAGKRRKLQHTSKRRETEKQDAEAVAR